MKVLLVLTVLFPLLRQNAAAEDLHERLDRVVKELRSDDADERDRGSVGLEAIAKEAPELVLPLARDTDPEVRGRVRNLLKHLHLLADSPAERRAMDVLDRLSAADGKEREDLVDELLSLGAPAGELLSEELRSRALEPAEQPLVVSENGHPFGITTKAKNAGGTALWIGEATGRWSAPSFLGSRRISTDPVSEYRGGQTFSDFENQAPDLKRWLQSARRIPSGSSCALWNAGEMMDKAHANGSRVVMAADSERDYVTPVRAVVGGIEVCVSNEPFPNYPVAKGLRLQVQQCLGFTAKVVRNNRRAGLEITAEKDCPDVLADPEVDNFWFVALSEAGEIIEFGPMESETLDKKSWIAGENMTVLLQHDIPAGTARLWLGYDWGVEAGQGVVPPPLEIPKVERATDPK